MDTGRSLLSSPSQFLSRTYLKIFSFSSSVLMLHDQTASVSTASSAGHFPTSVLTLDQRDESRPLMRVKDDNTLQVILERRLMGPPSSANDDDCNSLVPESFKLELLNKPELWYLFPSFQIGEQSMPCSSTGKKHVSIEPHNVVALAREALSASQEAASVAEFTSKLFGADLDSSSSSRGLFDVPMQVKRTVRSTRLQERRSKKRRVPLTEAKIAVEKTKPEPHRKADGGYDPNDPLRLFLWGPETRQLLTAKEESEIIVKIKELMKLEEVKTRLNAQFSREPTLVEWAEALGITCQALQAQIHSGNSSREKLIHANFRMVVHIAKQYQGRGLSLQDLLQEGSMGLMKSVDKFKPQAGCRFATYAYWWIRQSIRKAIFQHSRTIRLPENVYSLLSKVNEAKKLCIQEGNHQPVKEEIALRAGITVEKLDRLLFTARTPLSMQQPVWSDQNTTFQEITADTTVEAPDMSVAKQLMRRHLRGLLSVLSPKERRIIRLRFGLEDGERRSLSEIGAVFGLSKERVRQLESRALYKLKQCLDSQGLGAYENMLV